MADISQRLRGRGEPLRCPSCGSRLIELERSEIMIDACPECRGVWLERGELDRLLDRERRMTAGVRDDDEDFFDEMSGQRGRGQPYGGRRRPEPEYERPYGGEYDHRRRRRGLFEELFDFD